MAMIFMRRLLSLSLIHIFASTLYVYGKSGGFYRCSKQACELYIENYHDMFGLEYTILRYGSLYGPRADRRNAINRFVAEALEKGTITYYGAPTALREYIHVEDAALSTVEILGPEYANQNIVLTGNQPMQVGDLFRMIEEMLGKPIEIKYQHDPNSGHYQICLLYTSQPASALRTGVAQCGTPLPPLPR